MAARVGFVDGFDHWVAIPSGHGALNSVWTHASADGEGIDDSSFQTGFGGQGRCLRMESAVLDYTKTRMFENGDSDVLLSFPFSFRIDRLDSALTLDMMSILASTGGTQFRIGISPLGKLVISGEGDVTLHTTDASFGLGIIYRACLTVDMTVANATVMNLWVNSSKVIDEITADFQDSTTQNMGGVRLHSYGDFNDTDNTYCSFDDFIPILGVIDNYGEVALYLTGPNVDILHQWTHSTGATGFGVVDEKPMNLSDYNSSGVVGNRDIFGFLDLTRVPDRIICVTQMTGTMKEEAGPRAIRNVLMVGGTEENLGADYNESQTYQFFSDHWLKNPETALEWTSVEYDALESGYEDAA